jgi:hypothetical protein
VVFLTSTAYNYIRGYSGASLETVDHIFVDSMEPHIYTYGEKSFNVHFVIYRRGVVYIILARNIIGSSYIACHCVKEVINMSDRRIDYENLVIPLSISLIDII